MDLATLIEESKVEKKTKGESKHYIPFTKPQWGLLEKAYSKQAGKEMELKPNDLKKLLFKLFGVTAADLAALDEKE